ncbi:hypothetical protein SEVIR_8G093350v4 [Setaria viridis]
MVRRPGQVVSGCQVVDLVTNPCLPGARRHLTSPARRLLLHRAAWKHPSIKEPGQEDKIAVSGKNRGSWFASCRMRRIWENYWAPVKFPVLCREIIPVLDTAAHRCRRIS